MGCNFHVKTVIMSHRWRNHRGFVFVSPVLLIENEQAIQLLIRGSKFFPHVNTTSLDGRLSTLPSFSLGPGTV